MEVYMQMEAVRAEVHEMRFLQRSPLPMSNLNSSASEIAGVAGGGEQHPWEVLEMLGKGAMGEVYKCKWRGLTVAIKHIRFQVKKY
jgi:serine/threonine protein kinase